MLPSKNLQLIGIIGAVIGVIALLPYYKALLSGKAKPNPVAFLIFGILGTISFFGQRSAGAHASLWLAFIFMLNPYVIVLLSLHSGDRTFAKKDLVSLLLAVSILIVWYVSKSAAVAIILVVIVNTIGKYLVAEKAYRFPHGDVASTWVSVRLQVSWQQYQSVGSTGYYYYRLSKTR